MRSQKKAGKDAGAPTIKNSTTGRVKVGIIGSQFQADIHAESFRLMPDEAEVVAVASPSEGNAKRFAAKHKVPRFFTDYLSLLKVDGRWVVAQKVFSTVVKS